MAIKIRNKNYWTPKEGDIVEDTDKGSIFENPYTQGPKRKLQDQYEKYLKELTPDSQQWTRIEELQKIHEKKGNINLLCTCYPDPSHSTIIQKAINKLIKPKKI